MEKVELELIDIKIKQPKFKEEVFIKYKRVGDFKPEITIGYLIKIDENGEDWFIYNQTSFDNEVISWAGKPNVL